MEPSTWSPPSWRPCTAGMSPKRCGSPDPPRNPVPPRHLPHQRVDAHRLAARIGDRGPRPVPARRLERTTGLHQDRRGQRCLCHRDGVRRRRSEPAGRPAPLAYSGAVRASDARPSACPELSVGQRKNSSRHRPSRRSSWFFPGTYVPASLAPALVTPTSSPLVVATAAAPARLPFPCRCGRPSRRPPRNSFERRRKRWSTPASGRPSWRRRVAPFRGPSGTVDFTEYNTVLYNFTNPRWKVKEYPTFARSPRPTTVASSSPAAR